VTALTDAAIEHEISSGMLPRAAVDIAYRQMLATERVAAALERMDGRLANLEAKGALGDPRSTASPPPGYVDDGGTGKKFTLPSGGLPLGSP
jgi:hypothetical protein